MNGLDPSGWGAPVKTMLQLFLPVACHRADSVAKAAVDAFLDAFIAGKIVFPHFQSPVVDRRAKSDAASAAMAFAGYLDFLFQIKKVFCIHRTSASVYVWLDSFRSSRIKRESRAAIAAPTWL
jgi:hypothetical protein